MKREMIFGRFLGKGVQMFWVVLACGILILFALSNLNAKYKSQYQMLEKRVRLMEGKLKARTEDSGTIGHKWPSKLTRKYSD